MANALAASFKEYALTQALNGVTIKVALMDTGTYTYSAAHNMYDDISAGVVGTPVALSSVTFTNGVLDADNATFSALAGASVESLWLYIDTGTAGTSRLIAYIDSATGLAFTPTGSDLIVAWSDGASKIFSL
jgi:hypothetical protein